MPRILHLSDLHFGRERPALVDSLLTAAADLRPDLIVISGDLTQRARRHELAAARAFVAALPAPTLLVPGNHDIPGVSVGRFLDRWRGWRSAFGDDREPELRTAGMTVLGANSVRAGGPYLDWSRGRLRPAQIERLAAGFAAAPEQDLRVLVLHHPLALTGALAHRGLVGGAALALERLSAAGVDLALGGHLHLPFIALKNGILIAQAGTGVSDRLIGAPNSFNLIEADDRAIRIEHWTEAGGRFQQAEQRRFDRRRRDVAERT